MRLRFENERLLAVVAHPDDAELLCGGTLARARDDGAAIGVCVVCRGDKGQPDPPVENLSDVRRAEMVAAADMLNAEFFEGGFDDGDLFDGPEARRRLIEVYRQFRPTLVLAHTSQDYHPDHRAASAVAEAASWFCASAGHVTASAPLAAPPALWWMDTINMLQFSPDLFVDVSDLVELKRQMIRCHRSQLARGTSPDFSALEELMLRQCRARGEQAGVQAAEAFCMHRSWKRTRAW